MGKIYKYKDGSRSETLLCGCSVVTTYTADNKVNHSWTQCPLHKRADELEKRGMNIHKALAQSLYEQITA